jgi:hypothetical protein
VLWAHVEEQPTALSKMRPGIPKAIDDVIERALAKAPDDRYQSCRELITAAGSVFEPETRPAAEIPSRRPDTVLGPAPGTIPSAFTKTKPSRVMKTGSTKPSPVMRHVPGAAEAPPAAAAGAPPGTGPAAATGAPPTAGSGAAATAGPGATAEAAAGTQPASTAASVPPAGGPPGAPAGWRAPFRRRPLLAGGAVLALLVVAAVVVWAVTQGGSSKSSGTMSMKTSTNAILTALQATNKSDTAKGLIPPKSCKAEGASMVTCSHPYFGADTVTFQTYGSLKALYDAYLAAIKKLAPGAFRANYGDCTDRVTEGEVTWNHNYEHLRRYSLAQSENGKLDDSTQAAGRLFCKLTNGNMNIIWTQNDGRLLGNLVGTPHGNTYDWWHGVHHSISLGGSGSSMSSMS